MESLVLMNLKELRTVRVLPVVVVRLIAGRVNWDPQSDGSKERQQSRELEGSVSPTNLKDQPELVEDEGLLEQDGDHELFEDPLVINKRLNNKILVS